MLKRSLILVKIMIIMTVFLSAFMGIRLSDSPVLMVFMLIFLLNMQLRNIYFKKQAVSLSLIGELVLIYFIHNSFEGLTYILIFNTLIDAIYYAENYIYGFYLLTLGLLLYLINGMGLDLIILSITIYISLVVTVTTLKRTSGKITNLEYLYDDVRRYSYELENAKKQIETYSKKVEHLSQMEERNRISEEIHDTIGHRLTAILIQLEAGIRVIDSEFEGGKKLIEDSRDNLRESIDVLRETVKGMKPRDYKNLMLSLQELIGDFKKKTGVNASLEVKGSPFKLYPGVELVIFKNTQEALTNAVRHGKAKNIKVLLTYYNSKVELLVKDDGIGCSNVKKGMGITAMEERLNFIGGTLDIYGDKGFTIKCIIPVSC